MKYTLRRQSRFSISVQAMVASSSALLALLGLPVFGQTGPSPLSRWQAQYTQIYFDNIEAAAPTLGTGFTLGAAGSLTANPSEVISGKESIRGSYSGTGTYTPYLQTDPSVVPLSPNHSYQATFQYKILTAPSAGFEVLFYSPTGGAVGNFLPSVTLTGQAGTTGTATLTNTLGGYTDYRAIWTIPGTGAISIDNIQLTDGTTGKLTASESAEGTAPHVGSGLQLQNGAIVTTDPTLTIGGKASIFLPSGGGITSVAGEVSFGPHSTYVVEFDYRVTAVGPGGTSLYMSFAPPGPYDQQQSVTLFAPLKNAPTFGHFSAGALTNQANSYLLYIVAAPGWSVVIDNITFYRQSAVSSTTVPASWKALASRPFPRLGNYRLSTPNLIAAFPFIEPPFTYSVNQIENRLAFADVIGGIRLDAQSNSPDSLRRLRQLNPNAVILPYRISEEQPADWGKLASSSIDPDYDFLAGFADQWYVRDTNHNYVSDPMYPSIRKCNISSYCPMANGDTYTTYLSTWLDRTVFGSGLWDGVYLDNLFGRTNPHILNFDDPSVLNYDWNLNGVRDETPASSSDMTRQWAVTFLKGLQNRTGGGQIVIGNAGSLPEIALAPYVNGYLFECFDENWDTTFRSTNSPGGWRQSLETYLMMEQQVLEPKTILLEGCGRTFAVADNLAPTKTMPTAIDIQKHRFDIATTMLGDGFYQYDLWDSGSAPYWFDEYSVDSNGLAMEDLSKKGYLGAALTDAAELVGPAILVYSQGFENGLPESLSASPAGGVFVSNNPNQVIAGTSSLVISNPDHTQKADFTASLSIATGVPFGSPALIRLKWRITQTLDGWLSINILGVDGYRAIGVVAGDSGIATIPITAVNSGNLMLSLVLQGGGGEVAIDDVQIFSGGVGPWRRDFEGGFVLVNPLSKPHTFSAADLAGALNRSGIKRIKGTQAPDINNGQPVTGALTLAPFDAILLLADRIRFNPPGITGVASAASGQPGVISGALVSIYGSNFTPLPYDDWSKSISNSRLPTKLDGISVTIGGKPAYINAITPGQINVQAPDVVAGALDVTVTTPGGTSATFATNSQVYGPAFFGWPGNQPVVTHADYSLAVKNGTFPGTTTVPAKPGEIVILWGTGFGPTTPLVPAGEEPTVQAAPTQAAVSVSLGGITVPVVGAVLSSYAAVYQLAIQIPASMADGDYPIVASANGAGSPANVLTVRQ